MTLFEELKWRGLVKDITSPELEKKLNEGNLTFYWGTDPTADSLHLGHYSSLVTNKRLANYGHKFILLLGGATALIGDPRPSAEREIISKDVVQNNMESIKKQVKKLVNEDTVFVNNYDWMKNYNYLDFLRDVGKYVNVNYMLNKDIISRRLETGITYAEFSYTLMQGFDFVHLNRKYNCTLQAAGSDQWGNITTGVELAKKMDNKEVFGFTMPLILDAQGKKFGKSEGNALWLDEEKTPAYDIYQYLINSDDKKVIEYLKVFTFLSKEEIERIEEEFLKNPENRLAQKTLAYEVVKDLHGIEKANETKKRSEELFGKKDISNLPDTNSSLEVGSPLLDVLVDVKIVPSKSEGRRLVEQGGISVDGEKITDIKYVINTNSAVIQKGKKTFVKVVLK